MKFFVFLLLILMSSTAYTASGKMLFSSDSLKKIVLKQLAIKETEIKNDLWTEKVLPYSKTQTVVVIPKLIDEDEGMFTLEAVIALVNNQTGKITHRFKEENTIFSDAVFISGFTIDTAPFLLTKEIRAFGIRAKYYGSSNPNPYTEEQLSLFIPEGNSLRRVLKNEPVYTYAGEWNMNCDGEFHTTKSVVLFETKTTKNYFNLVIKEHYSKTVHEKIKGNCEEKVVEKKEKKKIYYYNGKSYN